MTAWEYLALWHRFGFTPTEVDRMPSWIVHYLLGWAP